MRWTRLILVITEALVVLSAFAVCPWWRARCWRGGSRQVAMIGFGHPMQPSLLGAGAAVSEDLPHNRVRICGTPNIIELFAASCPRRCRLP